MMATEQPFQLPLVGGCRCGRLRYQATKTPSFIFACHCTDCQQLSASAFSLGMIVPKDGFSLTQGAGVERMWSKIGSSGKESRQYHCAVCSVWLRTEADSAAAFTIVRPNTLDDYAWVRPIAQIFTRSALPWALMPVQFSYEAEFEDPGPIQRAFAIGGIRPKT